MKRIILNLDDLGMLNCINAAALDILRSTPISSVSVMAPGPWAPGFLKSLSTLERPVDIGVHLCLTSEWPTLRMRPVLGETVPSLLDKDGYLFHAEDDTSCSWDLNEVRKEFCAQIALVEHWGVTPTHLDAHMIFYFWRPELLDILAEVAVEKKLPLFIHIPKFIEPCKRLGALCPAYGNLANYIFPAGNREESYEEYLKLFPSDGVGVVALHVSLDHPELRAAMGEEGSRRLEEYDLFMTPGIFQRLGIDVTRPGEVWT